MIVKTTHAMRISSSWNLKFCKIRRRIRETFVTISRTPQKFCCMNYFESKKLLCAVASFWLQLLASLSRWRCELLTYFLFRPKSPENECETRVYWGNSVAQLTKLMRIRLFSVGKTMVRFVLLVFLLYFWCQKDISTDARLILLKGALEQRKGDESVKVECKHTYNVNIYLFHLERMLWFKWNEAHIWLGFSRFNFLFSV